MSMDVSVFHSYGFLVTDELAESMFQRAKNFWKSTAHDLYKKFQEETDTSIFLEYLNEYHQAVHYANADYIYAYRIFDKEETDFHIGEEFYFIELEKSPQLFTQSYNSYDEIIQEIQDNIGAFLSPDFSFTEYLLEIYGETWG